MFFLFIPVIGYFFGCLYPNLKLLDLFRNSKPKMSIGSAIAILVGMTIAYYFVVMVCSSAFDQYVIAGTCHSWGESCHFGGASEVVASLIFLVNIAFSLVYAFICQFTLTSILADRKATFLILSHMYFIVSVFFTFILAMIYSGLFVSYNFSSMVSVLQTLAVLSPAFSYLLIYFVFSNKYKRD